MQQVEHQIGPINILVNDAGFGLMEDAIDFEMNVAEKMFRVNVLGLMYMTKYVVLRMANVTVGQLLILPPLQGGKFILLNQ